MTMENELETAPPDLLEESPYVEPRATREPIPAVVALAESRLPSVVGDGSEAMPVFGVSMFDPDKSVHPFAGKCKVCELPLSQLWRNMDQRAPDGRWLFRGHLPVNCCETCYERAKKDETTLAVQDDWWKSKCPVEFRDEWNPAKGDQRIFNRVMQFDPKKGRGLVIHGPTDSGKTRAVWRLMRKLSEDGIEWLFVEAIDLLDNIPERAFSIPVLVIDDLGNDALTQQKEVRLLKLLRSRANWHRPVIITTQFVGASLEKRFNETATAQAVIRRLRAFCDDVSAKPL